MNDSVVQQPLVESEREALRQLCRGLPSEVDWSTETLIESARFNLDRVEAERDRCHAALEAIAQLTRAQEKGLNREEVQILYRIAKDAIQ